MTEHQRADDELAGLCHRAMSGKLEVRDLKPLMQRPVTVAEWDVTPGLHEWIEGEIRRRETAARAPVEESLWEYDEELLAVREAKGGRAVAHVFTGPVGDHIMLNDPDAVLRRCAADRKILAMHEYAQLRSKHGPGFYCDPCHVDDGVIEGGGNCPTILALAEAYGLEPVGEQDVQVRRG